jgi:hypothetical protein
MMNRSARTFRTKVTSRQIKTPEEICQRQNIMPNGAMKVESLGEQVIFQGPQGAPAPAARGLLRGYFANREDVPRFLDEECHAREDENSDHEGRDDNAPNLSREGVGASRYYPSRRFVSVSGHDDWCCYRT